MATYFFWWSDIVFETLFVKMGYFGVGKIHFKESTKSKLFFGFTGALYKCILGEKIMYLKFQAFSFLKIFSILNWSHRNKVK